MAKKENVFMNIKDMTDIEEYISSPRKFIENFCYIITKNATFELLKLNKPQSIIMDYVEECLRERKPIRVRILKARQMGFSTMISALGFWWATMNENSSYAVVAHKEDSTVSIYDKNRIFYENLPSALRPKTNRFNSEKISYDYLSQDGDEGGLKSRIFFGTAGGSELFRGETILFLHKSEKAFWENISMLNKSLNAAVPLLPFTAVFDESTANGYNHYKDEWDASVKGENDYKPFFFGWSMMDDYQMEVEPGFKLLDIEEEYMLIHDLTLKQMRWRRAKLVNDYGYDLNDIKNDEIDDFKQEYPLCLEKNTLVGTNNGIVPIKDIKIGDITNFGKVLRHIKNPIQKLYKLTTKNGYECIATSRHPFKTTDGDFVELEDLCIGDKICLLPPKTSEKEKVVEWYENGIYKKIVIDKNVARLLGYFMGDGSYNRHCVSFACDIKDEDVIEDISLLMKNIFDLDAHKREVGQGGGIELRFFSVGITEFFEKIGCLDFGYSVVNGKQKNSKKRKVCVPQVIKESPLSYIKEFLKGLFESDGNNSKTTLRTLFFTNKEEFAKEVQLLLLCFGIKSKKEKIVKKNKNNIYANYVGWSLIMFGLSYIEFINKIGFISKRKQSYNKEVKEINKIKEHNLMEDYISSIDFIKEEETYNLTIENVQEFDANGIWTHNCPEEAFISSGKSVFSSKVVAQGLEWARKNRPIAKYDIERFPCKEQLEVYEEPEIEEIIEYDQIVEFDDEQQKYVYKDTELIIGKKYRYANYLIAIDTSGSGQDRNVITVWHTYKKKKVAQWIRTNISEEHLAEVAVEIATYYNMGMIAPEINFSHSLVGFIEKLGYTNIYIGESETRIDKKKETLEYGWKTTTITKPILVSVMKKALNEDHTICPDIDFWEEAEYYLQGKSPSGKDTYNAAEGHHDDNVMSSMIGRHLCDSLMVKQNYTISNDKNLYESQKKLQNRDLSGIMVKKNKGILIGYDEKKGTKKLDKGVFRNNA